jgi:hypothetical protein
MAAVFDVSAEGLIRTTGIVPASSDYTLMGWFYVADVTPADYQVFFYLGNDPASYTEGVFIGLQIGTGKPLLFMNSTASPIVGTVLPEAGWYHITYTRTGTTHRMYVNAVDVCVFVQDHSGETHTHLYAGTDTYPSWMPGKAKQTREWSVALDSAQIELEMLSDTAQALTALVSDCPLVDDLLDDSGNANDWTAYDAVTFEVETRPVGSEYGAGTPTIVTDTYSDHDMQCPAAWENGFKEGIVERFGDGERIGSNPWTGDWQGSTFSLTLSDHRRRFRQQLRSTTDRFWVEPWTIRMTTRANRAVLGTPYTVFVGPVIDIVLKEPLHLEVTLGDIVSQALLTDDHQIPYRKIGDGPLSLFDEVYESLDREQPEPIIYGVHLRTLLDEPSPQGFEYVPTYLGTRTVSGTQWHAWMIAGHALADVLDLQTIDADGVHTSVIADEGTVWLIPHQAGYLAEFGAPYEDLRSDTYGIDRRYSFVYGKVGEADPDAVADGTLTLAVHLQGTEPIGDGSGDCITDRLLQYKHFLINYVANFGANSYQSGDWLPNPTWDVFGVATSIVEEDTFDACSAIASERLPITEVATQPSGYIGAAIIGARSGDRSSVRRWIADWNRSCQVQFGVNHFGQIRVWMLHPTTAIKAAAPLYTDQYEVLRGSFETSFRWKDMVNRVPFKTDYDHANGVWQTVGSAEAADAILNYARAIVSEDREYPFAPGIAMANHMAVLETRVRKHPPRFVTLEATVGPDYNNQSLGYLDLGDYIRYLHHGAVAEPDEIRLAQVIRHQVQAGRRVVQVEAFDCEELIGYDDPDALVPPPVSWSPSEFNDTCATAMEITHAPWTPFAITIDTTEHARDTSVEGSPVVLPTPAEAHHAAWFKFTPWANGTLFLTTVGSGYDTQMAVLSGTCGGDWTLEEFNDNDGVLKTSVLEFAVTGGVELHILVYGYGPDDYGSLTFGLYFTEPE